MLKWVDRLFGVGALLRGHKGRIEGRVGAAIQMQMEASELMGKAREDLLKLESRALELHGEEAVDIAKGRQPKPFDLSSIQDVSLRGKLFALDPFNSDSELVRVFMTDVIRHPSIFHLSEEERLETLQRVYDFWAFVDSQQRSL